VFDFYYSSYSDPLVFEPGCTPKYANKKEEKMKKIVVMILSVALLSFTVAANAGNETGPFIGGSLGYATTDVSKGSYNYDHYCPVIST
jgi:hypothetical protein